MVASTHWLASAAGRAVLERGGNAFDAGVGAGLPRPVAAPPRRRAPAAGLPVLEGAASALEAPVAAGSTLRVAAPPLNGPGGDLPAIVWPAGDAQPKVLCAQGPAPQAATIERYRDELGLTLVPGTGPLAAVVPGAFGGWLTLLRDHGTMELADVLQYAIYYAETGIPVLPQIAGAIRNVESLFRDDWTTSGDVYLGHGESLRN